MDGRTRNYQNFHLTEVNDWTGGPMDGRRTIEIFKCERRWSKVGEVRPWRPGSDRRAFIDFENFLTSNTVKVNPLNPTFANICSRIYNTYHLTDDPSVDF